MSGPENPEIPETGRLKKRREFTFARDGITERRKSVVIQARARAGEAPGPEIGAKPPKIGKPSRRSSETLFVTEGAPQTRSSSGLATGPRINRARMQERCSAAP